MIKIKVPLPANDASGGDAEWLWADPMSEGKVAIRNVPIFAKGISYGDVVKVTTEGDVPVFESVVSHEGHSTYRIYAASDRHSPEMVDLLEKLRRLHCDFEPATNKIVGVDVLPSANIYDVYRVLEQGEKAGVMEFEEGHCGHPTRTQ